MKSIYQKIGVVDTLPVFKGRKLYMHKSDMSNILLPSEFRDYTNTVDTILSNLKDRNNVCYITIDEKHINHETHRRSGIHVDFNWYEDINNYGAPTSPGTHLPPPPAPGWGTTIGTWNIGAHVDPPAHVGGVDRNINGGMLLVSNYPGCKVYKGEFDGIINEGGCCKDIITDHLESEVMPANEVFYLNALGIHESLLIDRTVDRSLIRINFHPNYVFKN